uniref:Uncharacterized protein n=1 Tax=Arundo donax TaxID=35708 RepID=A0A0A9ERB4_ARUDO
MHNFVLIHIDAKLCLCLGTSLTSSHLRKKCCVPDNSIICTQTCFFTFSIAEFYFITMSVILAKANKQATLCFRNTNLFVVCGYSLLSVASEETYRVLSGWAD